MWTILIILILLALAGWGYAFHARDQFAELISLRNEAQNRIVTWARCPKCGLPVACTGYGCPYGACRCGYIVLESEIEPCDPVRMVVDLREKLETVLAGTVPVAALLRDAAKIAMGVKTREELREMADRIEALTKEA